MNPEVITGTIKPTFLRPHDQWKVLQRISPGLRVSKEQSLVKMGNLLLIDLQPMLKSIYLLILYEKQNGKCMYIVLIALYIYLII